MRTNHTKQYVAYLGSLEWQIRRARAIELAGNKCQRCKASGETHILQVHHLSYERLGSERDEDLKVVCVPCHEIEDVERESKKAGEARSARVNGWASKVYGDDWRDRVDSDDVAERFRDWLDRQ